jgi:hypothetical protein
MAFEAVVAFWQKVQEDTQLQERVNPADGKVPRLGGGVHHSELLGLSEIAKKAGFDATPEEFAAAESVIRFWHHVKNDHSLQKSLKVTEGLTSSDDAAKEVARIAQSSGFHFSGEQLYAVTSALVQGGAGPIGVTPPQGSYGLSFQTALLNGWNAAFRYKVGPGAVAEYM